MQKDDLLYKGVASLVAAYAPKGRSESASFLNWFLENIYRLNDVEADDAICDKSNDKGIDGIYVDNTAQEIHLFQAKITQKDGRTLGDADLKGFAGALAQFSAPESIDKVVAGNANEDLKAIIVRQNLRQLVVDGYRIVGVFITNQDKDANCEEYLQHVDNIVVYDREGIVAEYIDFDADEGVKASFDFDVSYAGCLEMSTGGGEIYIFPARAEELIKLQGIEDTTLFKQNVRLTLGSTEVNKAIGRSIEKKDEHKNFPLYHNGITLLCSEAKFDTQAMALKVTDYVVVNGAQSISTFYKNAKLLSDDLRVFTKVIALRDEDLARKITLNSNNQNAIKARDMRSNHIIMLRLKAEFEKDFSSYQFEIKRGEPRDDAKISLTNEEAGRLLMAFDLNEPYSCHQVYKVFDDKYADIFGRPEVNASRIVFLKQLFDLIADGMEGIKNDQMAGYALTKFFVLNVLRHIMDRSDYAKAVVASRDGLRSSADRARLLELAPSVIGDLVIDFNYEIDEEGAGLDYKRDLKSPDRVRAWRNKLLSSYEKELKKKKAVEFTAPH
jgi:hypothetical protein